MKFISFLEKMKEQDRRMDEHCERLIGLNKRFENILEKLVTENKGEPCKESR